MSAAKSSRTADREPASYDQALAELEEIVQAMEAGQLGLDDTLAAYRRGNVLLKFCRDRLQAVEQQVQVLDADLLKPYPDAGAEGTDRD